MVTRPGHTLRPSGRIAALMFLALATFVMFVAVVPNSVAAPDRGPVKRAKLSQAGRSLTLQIATGRQIALRRLNRRPDFRNPGSRYLCLEINRAGRKVISRICLGGRKKTLHRVGVSRTLANGKIRSRFVIPARIKRPSKKHLVVSFKPGAAGLVPDRYGWRIASADGRCATGRGPAANSKCPDRFPPRHRARYRIKPVQRVGCTGGNGEVVSHGPRGRKRVALTFDDGPGPYTNRVLAELRKKRVKATFFMLGQEVDRYPATARRVLAAGHELANHSTDHVQYPGASNIAGASRSIKRQTGFRPCLFRPPYGAINSAVRQGAAVAGMKSILWDVDTLDWSRPGSGSIRSKIIHGTGNGSIVLMHDGGGPRGQTVAALSGAISNLRHRGYRFVTVTELLGNRFKYRPVG